MTEVLLAFSSEKKADDFELYLDSVGIKNERVDFNHVNFWSEPSEGLKAIEYARTL